MLKNISNIYILCNTKKYKLQRKVNNMKKIFYVLSFLFLCCSNSALSKSIHVNGYIKKDGTYVSPHERTTPDNNFNNNWSTKGNVNPYTGKEGTLLQKNNSKSITINNAPIYNINKYKEINKDEGEVLFDKSIK